MDGTVGNVERAGGTDAGGTDTVIGTDFASGAEGYKPSIPVPSKKPTSGRFTGAAG
jgi:hypothetical protein